MSDIVWHPMSEFVGDQDVMYLLVIKTVDRGNYVSTHYDFGAWEPIFHPTTNECQGWCLLDSGYPYEKPEWAFTIGDKKRIITHFAVIGWPMP